MRLIALVTVVILNACENDIQKVQAFSHEEVLPAVTGYEYEIMYTDSGRLKSRVVAPEIRRFDLRDNPHLEFPRGIRIIFYNIEELEESIIDAEYAVFYQRKELGEARKNVVARNLLKGEELRTEVLFWDQKTETVYSDQYSTINTPDGTFYGEKGFEADQGMNRWKLKQSKGTVNIKDEPEE